MIKKININGVEYAVTPVTEGEAANGVTVKVDGVTYLLGEPIVAPAASSGSQAIEKVQVNGVVYDIADVEGVEAEIARATEAEGSLGIRISRVGETVNKTNTDLTETKKDIANQLFAASTADKVNITGRNEQSMRINFSADIPAATTEKAGVMSAEDKKKVNASIKDIVVNPNVDDVELDLEDNTEKTSHVVFPAATAERAGVMAAADKEKLDNLSEGGVAELMQDVTYSELVALRDNASLVAGMKYRITDYVTTTVQKNTMSANHPFDVIVEAVSENELSEKAQAIQHEGDTYFDRNDLSAWELWYDLDNDTEKYEWADTENGKGVIYRMIDERMNDCPYDFKNIQFIRYELNAPNVGGYTYEWQNKMSENINIMFEENQLSYIWHGNNNEDDYYWEDDMGEVISSPTGETKAFFTFSNVINDVVTDKSKTSVCYSNIIKESRNGEQLILNNIVFFSTGIIRYCYSNSFGSSCNYNSFGNDCYSNSFRDGPAYAFNEDSWGYSYDNELIDGVRGNKFGDRCKNLLIHTLATTGGENSIQNLNIAQGLCSIELDDNDMFIPLPIEIDIVGQNYELKIGRDSNDEIKVYCEADLV